MILLERWSRAREEGDSQQQVTAILDAVQSMLVAAVSVHYALPKCCGTLVIGGDELWNGDALKARECVPRALDDLPLIVE
jgi:hypothetical protein